MRWLVVVGLAISGCGSSSSANDAAQTDVATTPECAATNEPNDTEPHATPGSSGTDAAICPATDVDQFVVMSSGGSLTATATYASGGPLMVSITNSGGALIANGTPVTGGVRAQVSNLPSGIYYVRITASQTTDYHLGITNQ